MDGKLMELGFGERGWVGELNNEGGIMFRQMEIAERRDTERVEDFGKDGMKKWGIAPTNWKMEFFKILNFLIKKWWQVCNYVAPGQPIKDKMLPHIVVPFLMI